MDGSAPDLCHSEPTSGVPHHFIKLKSCHFKQTGFAEKMQVLALFPRATPAIPSKIFHIFVAQFFRKFWMGLAIANGFSQIGGISFPNGLLVIQSLIVTFSGGGFYREVKMLQSKEKKYYRQITANWPQRLTVSKEPQDKVKD